MIRATFLLLLILTSCALYSPDLTGGNARLHAHEIMYVSPDTHQVMVFSRRGARFGPILNLVPPAATRYFEPSEGVQCVSIGIPGNTIEYAVKRPIRAGERYQCGRTSFQVTRCFDDCRAAVIEHDSRFADNLGVPEGYLYVNSCLGIVAFSDTVDPSEGVPLNAELLRSAVGILADPRYPDCRSL